MAVPQAIQHPEEPTSNVTRDVIARTEPRTLRTYTPTHAVLAKSSGVFHWTQEGRRLYDFSSGVLVANLGHNPTAWQEQFLGYMGWPQFPLEDHAPFFEALPLTAYNAVTPIEAAASRSLIQFLRARTGGGNLEQVMWAASGSEAVQKALWAALARKPGCDKIIATRYGFHGKKGLAGAVTGCETDPERDPRVSFITFPVNGYKDVSQRDDPFSPVPYQQELKALKKLHGTQIAALITEPYLGGAGSYHPPAAYLQLLQEFCRENDIVFILDEVQSNFGRTGQMFAFEAYGLEPDIVVLGKGLGNGVPVAAAVGPHDLFSAMEYGAASDTWSANPLASAAVMATLDCFNAWPVLDNVQKVSPLIEEGLLRLKKFPFVKHVRGEQGGMVWGVEVDDHAGMTAAEVANACVLACYRGNGDDGIHLLGPLAKKVLRIAPPLVITEEQAAAALKLMRRMLEGVAAAKR